MVHLYNGYNSAIKKNEIMKFACKWMEVGKKIFQVSILEAKRQIWYLLTYMQIFAIKLMITKPQSIEPKRVEIE